MCMGTSSNNNQDGPGCLNADSDFLVSAAIVGSSPGFSGERARSRLRPSSSPSVLDVRSPRCRSLRCRNLHTFCSSTRVSPSSSSLLGFPRGGDDNRVVVILRRRWMPECERCGFITSWAQLHWCYPCARYYCWWCWVTHQTVHRDKPWLYYLTPEERWEKRKSNEHW